MGRDLWSWRLNCRSDKSLDDFAHMFNRLCKGGSTTTDTSTSPGCIHCSDASIRIRAMDQAVIQTTARSHHAGKTLVGARCATPTGTVCLLGHHVVTRRRSLPTCFATPAPCKMLHRGVDTTVIALWLGHESIAATQMYLHADLTLKERALARTAPVNTEPGRFRPSDTLVDFLQGL
jgi:hypothetical protein